MMRLILRARTTWEKVQRGEVAGLGELATQEGVSGSYQPVEEVVVQLRGSGTKLTAMAAV
jgi:hypothetical protein